MAKAKCAAWKGGGRQAAPVWVVAVAEEAGRPAGAAEVAERVPVAAVVAMAGGGEG